MTSDTRTRILDTTADLFRRHGYTGTGMKQIVQAANAPFGSLYHHFPGGKEQLAAEVIFLTHTKELHEVNLRWHPRGEEVLWRPDLQEHKTSQASGARVLRYARDFKRGLVREFRELLAERMPYCRVRYAF